MNTNHRILLKLTGKIFINKKTGLVEPDLANSIVTQIKQLAGNYQFGIVIGGGNFFRGSQHGKQLNLSPWAAHNCGMLATLINTVMLSDMLTQAKIPTKLVSALYCPQIAEPINQQVVDLGLKHGDCIIFAGGTGNPYFTTDTNAVLRALEIGATEIWKGTSVNGVYESDPLVDPAAKILKTVSYEQALEKNLAIMDATAYALARDHKLTIRVFDIFEPNALLRAAQEPQLGTVIHQ